MVPYHNMVDALKKLKRRGSQIAHDLGFKHLQHFALRFKRHFGATPIEFRSTVLIFTSTFLSKP
jgi:AraC-like DNA-binding protein